MTGFKLEVSIDIQQNLEVTIPTLIAESSHKHPVSLTEMVVKVAKQIDFASLDEDKFFNLLLLVDNDLSWPVHRGV